MAKERDFTTEEKILETATLVFHEKGYDGARMQEIADKAQINKGLLHYYFKTKDSLFETIFSMALRKMMSQFQAILLLEVSLENKIDLIVDEYMHMLSKNSFLPRFVLNELNKNPDQFIERFVGEKMQKTFATFSDSIQKEMERGTINPIDSRQLFMNIISLVMFPFIGRPMIQFVLGADHKEFQLLLKERKDHIKQFIKQAIKK